MSTGAITSYIDVAQMTLYAFWIFFAGLVFYLRREDKREGYPLQSDRSGRVSVIGFPTPPRLKVYKLAGGGVATLPNHKNDRADAPVVPGPFLGSPMIPTGNPMLDGVGPASYANREDRPEYAIDGKPTIMPMRIIPNTFIDLNDPDPRGMRVVGADGAVAGVVRDLWLDRAEMIIRYLEVEVPLPAGAARNVLLPMTVAKIKRTRKHVRVKSILARQFAEVPAMESATQVTKLEEDKIVGYYGGGTLYATPSRQASFL